MGHGITSGWQKIASHPFFRLIDWYDMDSKQCLPMYIPPFLEENTINEEVDLSLPSANKEECFKKDTAQPIFGSNEGVMGWLNRYKRSSKTATVSNRYSQNLRLLEHKFKIFDYTIFDRYEGFLDERLMTVGPPPDWVKPAFPGADNGDILPVCKIYLETHHHTTTPFVFDVFNHSQNNASAVAPSAYYSSNANYNTSAFMIK